MKTLSTGKPFSLAINLGDIFNPNETKTFLMPELNKDIQSPIDSTM